MSSSTLSLAAAASAAPLGFDDSPARFVFFASGGEGEREASSLLEFRLRFLLGAAFLGGERESDSEASRLGFFRGGLLDLDSLSYLLLPFFRAGD